MTRLVSEDEKDLMRSDYTATLLDQLCDIERDTATGTDPHGHPLPPVWGPHIDNLACRFWPVREQERRGPNVDAVILDAEIEVPYGTDITEDDRIAEVRELSGEVIDGPFDIKAIRHTDVNVRVVLIRGK